MTPEQHNKYLGWSHLAYAAFHALMGLVFGVMMVAMFSTMPNQRGGNQPPPGFFVAIGVFLLIFSLAWSLPSLIAGYALLKKRKWAKIASLVAGVFAATQMPVGTAVGVYTFWFVFSPPGRLLYDQPEKSLLTGQRELAGIDKQTQKETQYIPPESPPDWR